MSLRLPPAGLCLVTLLACILPLTAAEKKRPASAADSTRSPDGHYRVKLEIVTSAEGGREQTATLVDAQTGATLRDLGSAGSPWTDSTRILWSPDSRRIAYVTASRRGDWTTFIVHHGDQWEEVPFPSVPDFDWKGRHPDSKTILASWSAVRWSRPEVLLVDNEVEDDAGQSAKVHYAFTFDSQNHLTVKRLKK